MDRVAILERTAEYFLEKGSGLSRRTISVMSSVLGFLWHGLDSNHRAVVLKNLELAWGDELNSSERQSICRRNFDNLARIILEAPYLRALNASNLENFITFSGMENFDSALQKGKGVLVLGSHFGNWELMSLGFSLRYAPFNVVVRPLDNPSLDRLIDGIRCRTGNRTIPKKGAARSILRSLSRNEIVALLLDQNVDWYEGVFVPFFKQTACTNKALAILALRTGAPVVPVYNLRMPDGRYRLFAEPEAPLIRTGDTTSDVEENTACFNRIIEGYVRRWPEQWFWMHKRWKTRPYQLWPRRSLKKQHWLFIESQEAPLSAQVSRTMPIDHAGHPSPPRIPDSEGTLREAEAGSSASILMR